MHEGIHIALSPEVIFQFWGIPVTNTLVTSWAVMVVLIVLAFLVGRNLKLIPGKIQILFETAFGFVLDYMEETLENKKLAERLFPLLATIFLFIFTANLLEFTPGIGSVGFFAEKHGTAEFLPLFRSVNTDLNMTLAMAIIAFFIIEISGIAAIGFLKYAGKFVNFKSVAGFVMGVIETFSEVARLVSFSFRLFGNIFAGEVLILVIAFFVPAFLPVPLMIFEVFVGFVQAAIFTVLTLYFVKIAIAEPH